MAPKTDSGWTQARFLQDQAVKEEHQNALRLSGVNFHSKMTVLRSIPWRTGAITSNHTLLKWVTDPAAREQAPDDGESGDDNGSALPRDPGHQPYQCLSVDIFRNFPTYVAPKPENWTVGCLLAGVLLHMNSVAHPVAMKVLAGATNGTNRPLTKAQPVNGFLEVGDLVANVFYRRADVAIPTPFQHLASKLDSWATDNAVHAGKSGPLEWVLLGLSPSVPATPAHVFQNTTSNTFNTSFARYFFEHNLFDVLLNFVGIRGNVAVRSVPDPILINSLLEQHNMKPVRRC